MLLKQNYDMSSSSFYFASIWLKVKGGMMQFLSSLTMPMALGPKPIYSFNI